ncbi:hypothetical protein NZK35_06700 [Stieleria sp. ICT_E10.1]|uniref:hypothetical protein n=1 Tax=Stieleria sedimenti TaxID=2976331 RepID=UPI0021804E3E|nr:hypothetical protein [Stieleria sedimenti]MCS7466363.1 hypothetical protein [Stieleria sedimenti]
MSEAKLRQKRPDSFRRFANLHRRYWSSLWIITELPQQLRLIVQQYARFAQHVFPTNSVDSIELACTTALGAESDAGTLNAAVPKIPRAKTPAATDFNNMTSTSSRQGLGTKTFWQNVSAVVRLSLVLMPRRLYFFTKSHRSFRSAGSSKKRAFA